MKQFLNPPGVQRANKWYTDVVTSRPGRIIYISGQGGQAADGKLPADFSSQAKNTFENLKKCLAAAGANFNDVVKMNTYLTDVSNQEEFRRTRAHVPQPRGPARVDHRHCRIGREGYAARGRGGRYRSRLSNLSQGPPLATDVASGPACSRAAKFHAVGL